MKRSSFWGSSPDPDTYDVIDACIGTHVIPNLPLHVPDPYSHIWSNPQTSIWTAYILNCVSSLHGYSKKHLCLSSHLSGQSLCLLPASTMVWGGAHEIVYLMSYDNPCKHITPNTAYCTHVSYGRTVTGGFDQFTKNLNQ